MNQQKDLNTLIDFNNDRLFNFLLIGILMLGIFLRVMNLSKDSLKLDEAQSIWQASHSLQFITFYMAQNVHLPLHNVLLHFWMDFFGSSESTVRYMSVIPGVLTLPAMYLLGLEILGERRKAMYVFFISAISPFWIWYSREIRMYTLLVLMATLSYYFYLKILRYVKPRDVILYTLVNLVGVYTHYFFNLVFLVQAVFFLLAWKKKWFMGIRHNVKFLVGSFVISAIAIYSLLSPWVIYYLNNNLGAHLSPDLVKPSSFNIVLSLFEFTLGYQPVTSSAVLIAFWPLLSLFGFAFLSKRDKLLMPGVYLAFIGAFLPIILIYLVSIFVRPMYLTRYIMISSPLYIVLVGWILSEIRGNFKVAANVLFIGTIVLAVFNQYTNPNIDEKENYRDAVAYVNRFATPRDIVAVSPPYTLFPVQYYYDGVSRLDTLPYWDHTKLNIPAATQTEIQTDTVSMKEGHRRIFLLSTANLTGADEVKYYLDHNYTRLQVLQFSPNIWLYVYQAEYPAKLAQK